ncbi:carbohydrate-binding module family 50 protein [Paxillus rubicundulus Ve08.2h10]|uniref:Carbohydrate-binding module family 50 protein n=1 Tax=Paxillus rubicundulus Ve08.2h10 TaxID=930991 RepID=A0A0D0D016_9AGAM|nr:carbohydrate-binding module family 50 protein [Paxillus rubicundulus Ve08.2h10]
MFGLLSTFVLAAASVLQAEAALPANCNRNATVAPGDTCDFISAKYNVSTYQLAAVNTGIIDPGCQNLYIGELLCLGLTGRDCQTTYVVRFGETCVDIARSHNISMNALLSNNPNLNQICTNLYSDEVLCVSSTIYGNLT